MARPEPKHTSDALGERLRRAEAPVAYDVAAGLRRHQMLVAGGQALPDWASGSDGGSPPGFSVARHWLPLSAIGLGTIALVVGLSLGEGADAAPHRAPLPAAQGAAPAARAVKPSSPPVTTTKARSEARVPTLHVEPLGRGATDPDAPEVGSEPAQAWNHAEAPLAAAGTSEDARVVPPSGATPPVAQAVPSTRKPPVPRARRTHAATGQRQAAEGQASAVPGAALQGPPGSSDVRGVTPLDGEEIRWVARARKMLSVDPLRALHLCRDADARFGEGYLRQERRYIEIRALRALGRRAEADGLARWFLEDYPDSAYTEEVWDASR